MSSPGELNDISSGTQCPLHFLDFFSYFNKREVSILRTFIDCLDLADQTLFPPWFLEKEILLNAVLAHGDSKLPNTSGKENFLESSEWRAVN